MTYKQGWLLKQLEEAKKDLEMMDLFEVARHSKDSLVQVALLGLREAVRHRHPGALEEEAKNRTKRFNL